jgi:uncharacterized membrane protein YtjA (UPF0391 family)
MLSWAMTFFILALIAAVLGVTGLAGTASQIAWIVCVVCLVASGMSMLPGRVTTRSYSSNVRIP